MRIVRVLVILVIQVVIVPLYGKVDQIRFDHITLEDGLSHSSVREILQDRRGFMWFGTSDGLNRYDGHKITVFRRNREDDGAVGGSRITALFEDGSGQLWVGSRQGGIDRFDRDNERFIHYRHHPSQDNGLSSNVITAFSETGGDTGTGNSQLWAATLGGGVNCLNPKTGTFTHYLHDPGNPDSLSSNNITELFTDKKGNLWIGSEDGVLNRWNREKNNFERYTCPVNPRSGVRCAILVIYRDNDGDLWIG
ncbi:MAG: histidine kinase, partial [bacterium]|nr:histidine kinase [bacterium]